jgi:hypothetical protein
MAQTLYWVVCDTINAGYGNDDASAVRIQQGRNAAAALLPAGQVGNLPAPAVTGTVPAGVAATGLTPGASYTIAWTIWDGVSGTSYGGGTSTKVVLSAPFNALNGTVYPVARAESVALTDAQNSAAIFLAARAESVALTDSQNFGATTYTVARAETVALTDSSTGVTVGGGTVYPVARAESVALTDSTTGVLASTDCDPFFTNVELLLHGDGNLSDSSPLNLTPTTTGSITTVANGSAFGGQEISFTATQLSYVTYTKAGGFLQANPTGAFTLECFINITENPSCGVTGGPANARGGFIRGLTGAATDPTQQLMFSAVCLSGIPRMNWMIGSAGATAFATWVQANRHYVAWTRDAAGRNEWWIDGTFVDFLNDSTAYTFDTIVVGNASGDNPVGGLIEEVRFTAGVARNVSTVPTAAFPNFQCAPIVLGSVAESVTLADGQTATVSSAGINTVIDTISIVDTEVARAIFNVGRSESFTLTDSQTGTTPGIQTGTVNEGDDQGAGERAQPQLRHPIWADVLHPLDVHYNRRERTIRVRQRCRH